MAASWAILGVTARMILCSAAPYNFFFALRATSQSLHKAAFLLTYFFCGGQVVCFFDPVITSSRPSECTKHICGGCSHTEGRHVFSRADRHRDECPESGCGKIFEGPPRLHPRLYNEPSIPNRVRGIIANQRGGSSRTAWQTEAMLHCMSFGNLACCDSLSPSEVIAKSPIPVAPLVSGHAANAAFPTSRLPGARHVHPCQVIC